MVADEKANISYIDPNNIAQYDGKNFNDNITWNPEDLNISVDIQVVVPDRDNCGRKDYTDGKSFFLMKNKPFTSFFTGQPLRKSGEEDKDWFLTDSYTNISYTEIKSDGSGNRELLGVESIDITFDSHFFPQVTIKFVDVRGASLMMPEEEDYYGRQDRISNENSKNDGCRNFFRALFHFPYPVFFLTVKGFYGTRETFMLSVQDFKTSFNSENGNFDVTVKFIGHMYGIYSDLPFNYLIIAPYIGGTGNMPNNYWQSNQTASNGKFMFADGNPIPTFVEFLYKYNQIDDSFIKILNSNESRFENVKRLRVLREQKNVLSEILEEKKKYDENLLRIMQEENGVEIYSNASRIVLLKSGRNPISVKKDNFEKIISLYNEYVESDGRIPGDECLAFFEGIGKDETINPPIQGVSVFRDEILNGSMANSSDKVVKAFNDGEEENKIVFNEARMFDAIKSGKYFVTVYRKFSNTGEFFDNIKAKISEISKKIDDDFQENSQVYEEVARNVLGFVPTIENVFRMIYAHIDCYMHEFYGTLRNVLQEANNRYTDTLVPKVNISDTDIETNENHSLQLPPFVGFYKKNNDTGQRTKTYPFEYLKLSDKRHIAEVEFTERIYEGINGFFELYQEVKPKDVAEKAPVNPLENVKFIPLTPLDIIYDGENPYNCLNAEKRQEILGEIMKVFVYRVTLGKALGNITEGETKWKKDSPLDGELENILSSLPVSAKRILKNEIEKSFNDNKLLIPNDWYEYAKKYLDDNTLVYKVNGSRKKNGSIYLEIKFEKNPVSVYDLRNKDTENTVDKLYGSNLVSKCTNLPEKTILTYFDYDKWLYNKDTKYDGGLWRNNGNNTVTQETADYSGFINGIIDNAKNLTESDACMILLECKIDKKKKNLYFEAELLEGRSNFERAMMFLSTLIGEVIKRDFINTPEKKGRIMRMPKFLRLFIGSQLYFYRVKGKDFKFSINKDGVFTNGYKPTDKIMGKTISQIKELYSVTEDEFIKWASNDFKTIESQLLNFSKSDYVKKYGWFSGENCYDVEKTQRLQEVLTNFYLQYDVVLNIPEVRNEVLWEIPYETIKGLVNKLSEKLKDDPDLEEKEVYDDKENRTYNSEEDADRIKEEIYYTQKGLYDKWLSVFSEDRFKLKSPAEDKAVTESKVLSKRVDATVSEYNNFIFMDSFYNNIGQTFYIDAKILYEMLISQIGDSSTRSNRSVLEFISDIAYEHKLLFIALPVYNNFYDGKTLVDIFTPHTPYDGSGSAGYREIGNTYLLMYTHEMSHNVSAEDESKNGTKYRDDGVDLGDTLGKITQECTDVFCKGTLEKYTIPAFGVTFGRQNQSYFKRISVNMDNPRQTDFAIYNQFQLAAQEKNGDVNSPVTVGQNMFSIFSNRAYDCNVEMMGCANIMPTMYFQLNNIPLFKGAYMITKVEHHIKAGDMTTTFSGTRISRNAIPYLKCPINIEKIVDRVNGGSVSEITPIQENNVYLPPSGEKISKYFSLIEFLNSETARVNGITEQFNPSAEIVSHIREVALFLDGLREYLGYPIIVTSGYRCSRLNAKIGGSKTSAHSVGYAADIKPGNGEKMANFKRDTKTYCKKCIEKKIMFDQYIDERNTSGSEWVHIGIRNLENKQRQEFLKTTDGKTYTRE